MKKKVISKLKTSAAKNHAVPGKPLSEDTFEALITEAENGTFLCVEESKKIFQEWRKEKYRL